MDIMCINMILWMLIWILWMLILYYGYEYDIMYVNMDIMGIRMILWMLI